MHGLYKLVLILTPTCPLSSYCLWGSPRFDIGPAAFFFKQIISLLSFLCWTILDVMDLASLVCPIFSVFDTSGHLPSCSSISFFLYALFLVCFPILGVGQRGVVVFHVLAWVRAAVARPVERAAETPALCAPSRHSVSSHSNHFMYPDQSALTQQWPRWHILLNSNIWRSFETRRF